MNPPKFPKIDIAKLLSCKVLCPEHAKLNGYIESICSFPSCEFSKMLCSYCKEKNPEHLKEHCNYMKKPEDLRKTLENENDEFDKIVNNSLINANENLSKNLEISLEKEREKLNKFFEEFKEKFIKEIENVKIEIYSQIMKKYYNEIREEFHDFYGEKFEKFNENILSNFLHFYQVSQKDEKITAKEFENIVNLIFNSRIIAIQLSNLKEEKFKSILQNIPKFDVLTIEEFNKKIDNIFINSFRNLYYPMIPAISPGKTQQISLKSMPLLKKGCTFEEKVNTYEENEELVIKNTEDEFSTKVFFFFIREIISFFKISIDNLAEATKTLLSKGIPNEDLEISISLPV